MRALFLALAVAAAVPPARTAAQDYPSKPVLFVVPYAAGGGTETMARLLGRRLEQRLGKPFVIENRPGAGYQHRRRFRGEVGAGRPHHPARHQHDHGDQRQHLQASLL